MSQSSVFIMGLNDEDPVRIALQNELILQEFFNFHPLKSLLSTSQVDRFWNARARTYIRDHRKCTAFISTTSNLSPCTQLEQLDQDLARMSVIPFSSLKIVLDPHTEPHPGNSRRQRGRRSSHYQNLTRNFNKNDYENIFSKVKLKHLCISWHEDVVACPATFLIFRLLTEKAAELESLSFDRVSTLFINLFLAKDKLEFRKLRQLELLNLEDWVENDDDSVLEKILKGAPNLERIAHDGDRRILEILPENIHKILNKFELQNFQNNAEPSQL